MSPQEPTPNTSTELATPPKRKQRLLVGFCVAVLVVTGGGLGYARYFVYSKLAPQLSKQLSKTINRPIKLGKVQAFSPGGIRLGYSEMPATKGDQGSDRLLLQSAIVDFNLWQLLLSRRLELDITLVNPQVYIEQDRDNKWVSLDIAPSDNKEEAVKVEIKTIRLKNAALTVLPRSASGTLKPPIEVNVPYGEITLTPHSPVVQFDLDGELVKGGNIDVVGSINGDTEAIALDLRAKKMPIATVTDLLPLPFTLVKGLVDGQLTLNLEGGDIADWQGEVIAKGVQLNLPSLAKPIAGADSRITFKDQQLTFNELSGSLGAIKLAGSLAIDLVKGFQGKLLSEPVAIGGILETFELTKPEFVLEGQLQALVSVTGGIENPQLLIDAVNHEPMLVDRIKLERFQGTLAVIGNQFVLDRFVAQPTLGGQFQGQGLIQLPTEKLPAGAINIAFTGTTLPTNALAQLYGIATPVELGIGTADLQFKATVEKPEAFVVSGTAVVPVAGGLVTATDLKVTLDRWQTPAEARGLRMARLSKEELPIFLQNSLVNGEFFATGAFEAEKGAPLEVTGTARSQFAGGQAIAKNIQVADNTWRSDITLEGLELNRLAPDLPPVVATYAGQFVAGGSLENVSLDTVEVLGQGRLTLANGNGAIQTNNVAVAGGEWYSRAELKQLNVVSFSPQLARYVDKAPSNGSFDVRGRLDNVNLDGILAKGRAIANLAGGTVRVEQANLNQGQFSGQVTAMGVAIKPFVPNQQGFTDAQFNLVADVMEPTLDRMQAQGDILFSEGLSLLTTPLRSRFAWTGQQLQIQEAIAQGFTANGTVNIDAQRLEVDPLTAIGAIALNVNAQNLELASLPLPPNLQSLGLEGQGSFVGTVQGTPQKPMVDGSIQLANTSITALAFEPQLTGNIQTRSDRQMVVNLAGATDRLAARFNEHFRPEEALLQVGYTTVNAAIDYSASGLEPRQLRLQSNNLPVALLQAIAKDQDAVKQIDFPIGSIPMTGNLSSELTADLRNLSASGKITIDQPTVGTIKGDRLDGNFYYGNNTLMLRAMQWQKNNGRYTVDTTINFPTDPNGKPAIALASKIEQGRIEDILLAMQLFEYQDLQNLGKLSLPDYFGKSSTFDNSADLYQAASQTQPTAFPPDVISLKLPSNPQIIPPKEEAATTINCATLLNQQANQNSQALFSLGSPDLSFTDRLALLSCIDTQIAEGDEETTLLPAKLADLRGFVNGELHMNYDGKQNLEADFDFRGGYQQTTELGETITTGSPLQWGEIEIPFVIARGILRDNVLTLRPVKIQLPEGNVSFIGSFGGTSQNGQLGINEVPVAFLQKFIDLPEGVGVQGLINASANLAGTPSDPSARGDMSMTNTRINDADIASVTGNFTYKDARLDFTVDGQLVAETAPLNITGSIPYQLPNATVAPKSNDLNLTFNLKNEGFVLLNILSKGELAWLDGEGNVDLMIVGSIDPATGRPKNLVAEGQAAIAQATIQAKALPDAPITNVHGKIGFDLDNFTISELTGDFSGGSVNVTGSLPIAKASPEEALTVQLNALNFSFPNLYRGGVDGKLNITGTALEPMIGGDIKLYDGRVFLTDAAATEQAAAGQNPTQKPFAANDPQQARTPIPPKKVTVDLTSLAEFNNLNLTLDRNIQITKAPILNFLATGALNLNGTLTSPEPEGVIRLKRGQVNLFATQFRLDNGQDNTATFTKSLDPELDVTLLTSLVETPQSSLASTNPLSAEIQDNSIFSASQFGTIETIRVSAKVQGRASELNPEEGALNPIIELTSSPPRKKNELISLLGGTLLDSFTDERGGGTLALANLAGSALLNTIQDAIGNALGLSELRLFPTVITDEKARSSTLGLGAELGIDLSPSLSFSILQIINSDESTQFGLRYRVNDEIFVRGSTNLNDDSRLTIEYGLKF